LFESVVGRSQPILSRLPSVIAGHVLGHRSRDADARAALTGDLERQAEAAKQEGFDLDAMLDADLLEPPRLAPKLTLADLDLVLQNPEAMPPGITVTKFQNGEYAYQAPGMAKPVRITTRPEYFDDHTESLELWSPGSPSFPAAEAEATTEDLAGSTIAALLSSLAPKETPPP
jgi:hypothetical protein